MKSKKHASLLLLAAFIATSSGGVWSATTDGAPASPTTEPASVEGAMTRTLTGGVQTVTLSLERLRDAGLDLKEVMSAARHLYDEVNIRPVSIVEEPEIIGTAVIQIPISTQPIGPPEPPRKDRVDRAMAEMTPLIDQFKQNADAFVANGKQLDVAEESQSQLKPLINEWVNEVDNLSQQLKQLQQLTVGPTYDNQSISLACQEMQSQVKQLDKVRSQAYKIIRKEGKRKHIW